MTLATVGLWMYENGGGKKYKTKLLQSLKKKILIVLLD